MLAPESDDDTIGNDQPLNASMSIVDTIYPSLGFTVGLPLYMPPDNTELYSAYCLLISRPPGLDPHVVTAAALLVAQAWGSEFVDHSLLWSLTPPHMTTPEVALFANPNSTRHILIDNDDTINIQLPHSHLDSWSPRLQWPPDIRPQTNMPDIGYRIDPL